MAKNFLKIIQKVTYVNDLKLIETNNFYRDDETIGLLN